jgi:hypothetical protein
MARKYIKLDIACGNAKAPGWTGIDIGGDDADIKHDLNVYPWPIESGTVSEARISHYVEHIPHYIPGHDKDGWFLFWDEVYRITRKGATIHVVHPYSRSDRAFWDPTHTRYIHEMTWYYLDPAWRAANGLQHYTDVDFEVVVISGTGIADSISGRTAEHQAYARTHYFNVIPDLAVELKRR